MPRSRTKPGASAIGDGVALVSFSHPRLVGNQRNPLLASSRLNKASLEKIRKPDMPRSKNAAAPYLPIFTHNFRNIVDALNRKCGFSHSRLALAINVSRGQFSGYYHATATKPCIFTVQNMSEKFGVPMEAFVTTNLERQKHFAIMATKLHRITPGARSIIHIDKRDDGTTEGN